MTSRCLFVAKFGLILILFFLFSAETNATNYYVDKNHSGASNSNPGTLNSPWLTIQHAAETIGAGDTVFVKTGVYAEQVWTTQNGNGANGYIVFAAFPGHKPVIDGAIVSSGTTGIRLTHSYIKLIGFEIRNWDSGIWMENAGNIEISICEIHQCAFGIGAADGAHDFVLNWVEIHHFDLYGFDASPSGGADCYNGTFNDCISHSGRDAEQNVDGFALGHGTQHDFVFNRCTVYDIYDGFDISSKKTTLNECLAYDCWNGGYKLWQDSVRLVNCIGHSCPGSNVELDWDSQPGTTWLINCTFFDAGTFNIWVENSNDRLRMYNCILTGGDNIGLAFEQMGVTNYQGDYNIFHNDNSERAVVVGYTDEFSLDQVNNGEWASYSGQDGHSLVEISDGNLFINPAQQNFHLLASSIAVDHAWSEYAPAIDFDGKARPSGSGFDIGAYEYQIGTGIPDMNPFDKLPWTVSLFQNYPDPFNSMTEVSFRLPKSGSVKLLIFNLLGQTVKSTNLEYSSPGKYSYIWDAKDNWGNEVPSGVYLFNLIFNAETHSEKLLFIK